MRLWEKNKDSFICHVSQNICFTDPPTRLFTDPISQGSKHQACRYLIWARLEFDGWSNYVHLFFCTFLFKKKKSQSFFNFIFRRRERWGMTCNKSPQPDSNQSCCNYCIWAAHSYHALSCYSVMICEQKS